jgi:2'-5' RNA ligase
MYENAAEFGFTPSWQLQAHLDQDTIFVVRSVDGDPEIVYSAPAMDFDLPAATQALFAAVQRATPFIREEGFGTEAAVNVVDEPEMASPQGHEELSEPSTYPGGEQPGKTKLFPEIDHGVMRRTEGRRITASDEPIKPQNCHECKQPATRSIIWAEGMAYVPTCDKHFEEVKQHIEVEEGYGPVDNVREVKQKKADLESIVHQAIGEASMCWDPLPSSQVFDATAAHEIAIRLIDAIAKQADELHTGTFIGLKVPLEIAEKIAVEGGEPPGDMHITLWYSKGLTAEQIKKVEETFTHFWSENPSLHVELAGVDAFEPSESSDGLKPIYAAVNSPDIMALQKFFVEALAESGIKSDSEHAAKYIPHITLKYAEPGENHEGGLPEAIAFDIEDYVFSPGAPVDEKTEAPDEKEAEIGFSLFDLTKNAQGIKIDDYRRMDESYRDQNQSEDPDLHLGSKEGSSSPIRAAAFRNPVTGQVVETGAWHDQNQLPGNFMYDEDHRVMWEEGFVTRDGRFLDRLDAAALVNLPPENWYSNGDVHGLVSEDPESGLPKWTSTKKPEHEADVEAPYTTMGLPGGEMFDKDHEMNIKMHANVGQGSDPYRVGHLYAFDQLNEQHQAEIDLNWQDKQKNPTGRHFMWIRTFMPVATIIKESKKWYDKNRNRKWGQKDQRKVIALAERMEGGAVVTPLLISPPGEQNGGLWEGYHRLRAHDLLAYQRAPVLMKVDITDPEWKMKLAQATEGEEEREPWFCVDLDGTILEEDPNAHHVDNQRPPLGEPFPDVARVMGELSAMGRVSIYTARQYFEDDNDDGWKQEISEHLKFHNIPFDDIYVGKKPPADAFIDNKAINFDGDWSRIRSLVQEVMNRGKMAEQPPQQESVEDNISMEAAVEKEEFAQRPGNGDNMSDQYTDVDESREDRTITRPPAFENLV